MAKLEFQNDSLRNIILKKMKLQSIIVLFSKKITIFAFKFKILLLHERFESTEGCSCREEEDK